MTVKNPLTNQIIVGEVEFFLIQKDVALEKIRAQYARNNEQRDLERESDGMRPTLQAFYIGSDYTYAYSTKFRETIFKQNTLDENLLIGVTPSSDS